MCRLLFIFFSIFFGFLSIMTNPILNATLLPRRSIGFDKIGSSKCCCSYRTTTTTTKFSTSRPTLHQYDNERQLSKLCRTMTTTRLSYAFNGNVNRNIKNEKRFFLPAISTVPYQSSAITTTSNLYNYGVVKNPTQPFPRNQSNIKSQSNMVESRNKNKKNHLLNNASSSVRPFSEASYGIQRNVATGKGSQPDDIVYFELICDELKSIQMKIDTLTEKLPPLWTIPDENYTKIYEKLDDIHIRKEIFHEMNQLMNLTIMPCLDRRILEPDDKHRNEFFSIIDILLRFYCHCVPLPKASTPTGDGIGMISVFEPCLKLYQLLKVYKYDINPAHYSVPIEVGAREGRWIEVAAIYDDVTDPGFGSLTAPVVDVEYLQNSMMGLYVTARSSSITGTRPVENVMDSVVKMTMNNPSISEAYIIAAGSALGYAGESVAFQNYLKTSCNASDFGQPLIASVMQACILNNRYEDAVEIFEESRKLEAVGGDSQSQSKPNVAHPLCRDLALRALGGIVPTNDTSSGNLVKESSRLKELALHLFRQILEANGTKLSVGALYGVVKSCENDGDWETATNIFATILHKQRQSLLNRDDPSDFLILDKDLERLFTCYIQPGIQDSNLVRQELYSKLGVVANSVIRSCNSAKMFLTGLLQLCLFESSLLRSSTNILYQEATKTIEQEKQNDGSSSFVGNTFVPILRTFSNVNDVTTSAFVSLCGIGYKDEAVRLNKSVNECLHRESSNPTHLFTSPLVHSKYNINEYALSQNRSNSLLDVWGTMFTNIQKIAFALDSIENTREKISSTDAHMLSALLSKTISACTSVGEPEAGIQLARWAETKQVNVDRPESQDTFFRLVSPRKPLFGRVEKRAKSPSPLPVTDALVAALAEAFRLSKNIDLSEEIVHDFVGGKGFGRGCNLTNIESLHNHLHQGNDTDVAYVYHSIIAESKNAELLGKLGKMMYDSGHHRQVIELFELARESSCDSDDLPILAMKSSSELKMLDRESRIGQLTAKWADMNLFRWYEINYFKLEKTSQSFILANQIQQDYFPEFRLVLNNFLLQNMKSSDSMLLSTIVSGALEYVTRKNEEGIHPPIPQDKAGWTILVSAVVREAENTSLIHDPKFLHDIAQLYNHLECYEECIEFAEAFVLNGRRLDMLTLQEALKAARLGNLDRVVDEIEMLAYKI